jgi:hypothetical protein
LLNTGVSGKIVVTGRMGKDQAVPVFEEYVETNEIFTLPEAHPHWGLGTTITLTNDESGVVEEIHTSCSVPLGPGTVVGPYHVINGFSRLAVWEGVPIPLCPDTGSGDVDPPAESCACEGRIDFLRLLYSGPPGILTVTGKWGDQDVPLLVQEVADGSEFDVAEYSTRWGLGTGILLAVESEGDADSLQLIHTSCSEPVNINSVWGPYTVLAGTSRLNDELCEEESASRRLLSDFEQDLLVEASASSSSALVPGLASFIAVGILAVWA